MYSFFFFFFFGNWDLMRSYLQKQLAQGWHIEYATKYFMDLNLSLARSESHMTPCFWKSCSELGHLILFLSSCQLCTCPQISHSSCAMECWSLNPIILCVYSVFSPQRFSHRESLKGTKAHLLSCCPKPPAVVFLKSRAV